MRKIRLVAFTTITLATLLASSMAVRPAHAGAYTWTGATAFWGTAGNWSPSTEPGGGDEADFSGTAFTNPTASNSTDNLGQFHALATLGKTFSATFTNVNLTLTGSGNNTGILIDPNSTKSVNVVTIVSCGHQGYIALGSSQSWTNNNTYGFGSGQYSLVISSTAGSASNHEPGRLCVTLNGSGNTQIVTTVTGAGGSLIVNGWAAWLSWAATPTAAARRSPPARSNLATPMPCRAAR